MIKSLGNKKYRLIVSVGGRDSRRRFTRTITCEGGMREARKLYTEFEAECQRDPLTDVTVRQLLDNYIAHLETLGRKATTVRNYKICAKRLYQPTEGILAKNLTTAHIERIVSQMSQNGLAPKTIKNTESLLSAAYNHAIFVGQLESNPCDRVSLPKGQSRDIRILYMDEIQPFLNAIAECDINEKCAYMLALFMGLRRSEILGLKESDVDIVRGFISVHSTRHRVGSETIIQNTKTARSTRVLAMPEIVTLDIARLLEAHRQFPYEKVDFLIQDGCGNIINPQALSSRLTRLEEKWGLPHVTLHGLRHTYASLLHNQKVDMAQISLELGHSSLTTTMGIYTHIFSSVSQSSRNIASTVDNFLIEQNEPL